MGPILCSTCVCRVLTSKHFKFCKFYEVALMFDYQKSYCLFWMSQTALKSDILLKMINIMAETTKVDGHISRTFGPNLFIFGKIGANIVNF